jgi:hypothetical protein
VSESGRKIGFAFCSSSSVASACSPCIRQAFSGDKTSGSDTGLVALFLHGIIIGIINRACMVQALFLDGWIHINGLTASLSAILIIAIFV